jgi:ribosome biogenesis GTPase
MSLQSLGWNASREQQFTDHRAAGCVPARIAREDRGRYIVLHEGGDSPAEVTGRFRHEAAGRSSFPAVGDWVAVRLAGADASATIVAVLPRTGVFARKVAGETTEEQIVAANVDAVFVVAGLDGDFNPRRIERFLAAAWDSGAQPVVVLNKMDLAEDLDAQIAEVEASSPGVPVVATSALAGDRVDALAAWLGPGTTVALLGSSGVGKSTLVNALLGDERQATGAVREDDSRGRHTTTRRELVALPSGALLIDTPGMRELQLWADESSLESAFPDIEELARSCRFGDCSHVTEPGCAVLAAADAGALEPERLTSWRKLQRELRWLAAKQDSRLKAEQTAKWKAIHKSMRNHPKLRARGER